MNTTLNTTEELAGTLLADLTPEELTEYENAVTNYNGGEPLTVPQLARLFGVKTNTIYAAWIGEGGQPSTELIPGNYGDNTFDATEVIPWGVQTGRLEYVKATQGFQRRRIPRLIWPGKPRGPHRKDEVE